MHVSGHSIRESNVENGGQSNESIVRKGETHLQLQVYMTNLNTS